MAYDVNKTNIDSTSPYEGVRQSDGVSYSDTLRGNSGFNWFDMGVLNQAPMYADFAFGNSQWNGLYFDNADLSQMVFNVPGFNIPDGAFNKKEYTFDYNAPLSGGGTELRTYSVSSQLQGVFVYASGEFIDADGMSRGQPTGLSQLNFFQGKNAFDPAISQDAASLANEFDGFAVYSMNSPTNADGSPRNWGTMDLYLPQAEAPVFFDDVNNFEGTDFSDVFFGDQDTEWTSFRGNAGIDFMFGGVQTSDPNTGRLRGHEALDLNNEFGGTFTLLDNNGLLAKPDGNGDVVPIPAAPAGMLGGDGSSPANYYRTFGVAVAGDVVVDFDAGIAGDADAENDIYGVESIDIFTNIDVIRGTDSNDIIVGDINDVLHNSATAGENTYYRLEGDKGDDLLVGGNSTFEDLEGGQGNDTLDFGNAGSGGAARYELRSNTTSHSAYSIKIVDDETGIGQNKVEIHKTGTVGPIHTFNFQQQQVANYQDYFASKQYETQISKLEDGAIDNIDTLNSLVQNDAEVWQVANEDVVISTGQLDYWQNDQGFATDTLIGASQIKIELRDVNNNYLDEVRINVDGKSKAFSSDDALVKIETTDPILTFYDSGDWTVVGSSGGDVFNLVDYLDSFPSVATRWGDVNLGDGDDVVNLEGTLNGAEIVSSKGNDTYQGSLDWYDNLNFRGDVGSVTVNAITGTVADGFGGTDTFKNIDGFQLSNNDDTFTASFSERTNVTGNGGNDTFIGTGDVLWERVRYDQEHWGGRDYEDMNGVVVNLGTSAISYVQLNPDRTLQGGVVGPREAIDTFGDVDTFATNEFGQILQNVQGSRYHDDVLIGGAEWNNFRGQGGDDFIDGGSGGGHVSYLWDTSVDARPWDGFAALNVRGIVANLSNSDLNLNLSADFDADGNADITGNLGTQLGAMVDPSLSTLKAGQVIDSYGYIDTIQNISRVDGTNRDDIIFTGELGMPFSLYGNVTKQVELGAGTDLLIDTVGVDNPYEQVRYGNTDEIYKHISNWDDELTVPVPTALNFDLVSTTGASRITFSTDALTIEKRVDTFLDTLIGSKTAISGSEDLRIARGAAEQYMATLTDAELAATYAYRIKDPFGDSDFVFNVSGIGGTTYDDTMKGDSYDNQFSGYEGDDVLLGRGGNDFLRGESGNDVLDGGAGGDGGNWLQGGRGDDQLILDIRSYMDGSKTIAAGEKAERISGDSGSDTLRLIVNDADVADDASKEALLNKLTKMIAWDDVTDTSASLSLSSLDAAGVKKDKIGGFREIERIEIFKATDYDANTGMFASSAVEFDYSKFTNDGADLIKLALAESIEGAEIAIGGSERDNILADGKTRVVFSGAGDDFIEVTDPHSATLGNNLRINTGIGNDVIDVFPEFRGSFSIDKDINDAGYDRLALNWLDVVDIDYNQSDRNVSDDWRDATLKLSNGAEIVLKDALTENPDGTVTVNSGAVDVIRIGNDDPWDLNEVWKTGSQRGFEDLVFNVAADNGTSSRSDATTSNVQFGTNTAVAASDTDPNTQYDDDVTLTAAGGNGVTYFALEGDDSVIGTAQADRIYGGDGDDYLQANAGDDRLYGGKGDDTLAGGAGENRLIGGEGSDTYIADFTIAETSTITETAGDKDKLVLEFADPEFNPVILDAALQNGTLTLKQNQTGSSETTTTVSVEGFEWGADTLEQIVIRDTSKEATGGAVTDQTYNLSTTGIVADGDTSNYMLFANQDIYGNTMYDVEMEDPSGATVVENAILGLRNTYDANGNLTDSNWENMMMKDLVEIRVQELANGNFSVGLEDSSRSTRPVYVTQIGDVNVSGHVTTEINRQESSYISADDASKLFGVTDVFDLDAPISKEVTAAEYNGLAHVMAPGAVDVEFGFNVGSEDFEVVTTVGGDGDDIIYGVDSAITGEGAKADLIIAEDGDDIIVTGGGVNMVTAGDGADNISVGSNPQLTVIFGDKIGADLRNGGEMAGIEKAGSLQDDVVFLNVDRRKAHISGNDDTGYIVQYDHDGSWDLETSAKGTDPGIFTFDSDYEHDNDDSTAPAVGPEIFTQGYVNSNFDAANDIVIELHDVEKIVFGSGEEVILKTAPTLDWTDVAFEDVKISIKDADQAVIRLEAERITETTIETLESFKITGVRNWWEGYRVNQQVSTTQYSYTQNEDETYSLNNGLYTAVGNYKYETVTEVMTAEEEFTADTYSQILFKDGEVSNIYNLAAQNKDGDSLYLSDEMGIYRVDAYEKNVNDGTNKLDDDGQPIPVKTYLTGVEGSVPGKDGHDIIIGTKGDDIINGGYGNDIILGRDGDDQIIGGAGEDVLMGGKGDDILSDFDKAGFDLLVEDYKKATTDEKKAENLEEQALLSDPSDDILVGGEGFDKIDGDGGEDLVIVGDVDRAVIDEVVEEYVEQDMSNDLLDKLFSNDDFVEETPAA